MRKVVVSGMIGNGLEWYDYALYGHMALILSQKFFPQGDPYVALLATFGVFAAGFLVRPLGAVLFGYIGDRYGRRLSLTIAILMMAIPTGCVALLPTYDNIGIWAPILLTLIRLLQGLSLGGEFSGSITYIVEHAPAHRRGLAGSASLTSLVMGFMLGTLVATLTSNIMGEEVFHAWGWRIPFGLGILVGLIGFYIRTHCEESPHYEEAKNAGTLSKTPVREVFKNHPWAMAQCFGVYMTVTMPFYLLSIYFTSFTTKFLERPMEEAFSINFWAMAVLMVAIPFSAWLSDHIGRKRVMMTSAIAVLLVAVPVFMLLGEKTYLSILAGQMLFALVVGCYMGPVAAFLVEMFPTSVRYTGMALAYNFCAAIFGGTAPMVCEWLIHQTGSMYAIAGYVVLCNLCSLVALAFYRDRFREALR